jgi:hypothetical protein
VKRSTVSAEWVMEGQPWGWILRWLDRVNYNHAPGGPGARRREHTVSTTPLMHPALAELLHKQRAKELAAEAHRFRLVASLRETAPRVSRLRVARREGKVTWIETVQVQHPA